MRLIKKIHKARKDARDKRFRKIVQFEEEANIIDKGRFDHIIYKKEKKSSSSDDDLLTEEEDSDDDSKVCIRHLAFGTVLSNSTAGHPKESDQGQRAIN